MNKIYVYEKKYKNITLDLKCSASKANYYRLQAYLIQNSYKFTNNIEDADYLLINMCNHNSDENDDFFEETRKNNKWKKIIMFWCSKLDKLKDLPKWVIFIYSHEPENIEKYIKPSIKNFYEITSMDVDDFRKNYDPAINRYYIEVSRGCANYCSFCPIKKSIGFVKSKPIEDIIDEFEYALNNWYKEISLVSEDCWSYWLDIWLDFSILFNKLTSYIWNYCINLNYISPNQLLKNFPKIKKNAYRISRMILWIQSFSDRILKLMNRNYKVDDVINLIHNLREQNNEVYIENQLIYCYPTETREEFTQNLKFAKYYDENIFNLYSNKDCIYQFPETDIIDKEEIMYRTKVLSLMRKKCNYMNLTWDDNSIPW